MGFVIARYEVICQADWSDFQALSTSQTDCIVPRNDSTTFVVCVSADMKSRL